MTDEQQREIKFCVEQILAMVTLCEGRRLPDFAAGAIEGWCQRLLRLAETQQ